MCGLYYVSHFILFLSTVHVLQASEITPRKSYSFLH